MDVFLFRNQNDLLSNLGQAIPGLSLDFPILSGLFYYFDVMSGIQISLRAVLGQCHLRYLHVAAILTFLFDTLHEKRFTLPEFTVEVFDPKLQGAQCVTGKVARLA